MELHIRQYNEVSWRQMNWLCICFHCLCFTMSTMNYIVSVISIKHGITNHLCYICTTCLWSRHGSKCHRSGGLRLHRGGAKSGSQGGDCTEVKSQEWIRNSGSGRRPMWWRHLQEPSLEAWPLRNFWAKLMSQLQFWTSFRFCILVDIWNGDRSTNGSIGMGDSALNMPKSSMVITTWRKGQSTALTKVSGRAALPLAGGMGWGKAMREQSWDLLSLLLLPSFSDCSCRILTTQVCPCGRQQAITSIYCKHINSVNNCIPSILDWPNNLQRSRNNATMFRVAFPQSFLQTIST